MVLVYFISTCSKQRKGALVYFIHTDQRREGQKGSGNRIMFYHCEVHVPIYSDRSFHLRTKLNQVCMGGQGLFPLEESNSLVKVNIEQEAARSMMGRRATSVNLLAFSVAMLSQRTYRGKLVHWAKCLHLGVGQVASECTSGLNGLMVYLLDQNKVWILKWIIVIPKIASWFQIAITCSSLAREKLTRKSQTKWPVCLL